MTALLFSLVSLFAAVVSGLFWSSAKHNGDAVLARAAAVAGVAFACAAVFAWRLA